MKILLLSDIPPCDNYTAGLVLSAMVRLVPRDEICCFTVANPILDFRLTSSFANIPIEIHAKPNENWAWLPRPRLVSRLSSVVTFVGEHVTEKTAVRGLINKAVSFGREQKVDRVWAVLQGQTTIRMAQAVAQRLGVPLHTHVWDPFSWWAKANCIDGATTRRIQAMFDDAIRNSRSVATASEPMAELFRQRFNVPAVPVIASHSISMAQTPDLCVQPNDPVVIGMAGQFYAAGEWLQLLHAMKASSWTIAGRPVRIVVMGPQRPPGAIDEHVSFLGWKSQPDAAFILSLCDILYCPYPFDEGMKEVSQYSFPSKLVLYLAAGRPILFHGPDYSSPAHYIRSRQCGVVASRLVATAAYNELERLISNPTAYRAMAENAQAAFLKDFTLESMHRSFSTFIGGEIATQQGEIRLHDHTRQGTPFFPAHLPDAERLRSPVWLARTLSRALLTRYAHMRRQLKSPLRRVMLRIPRLQSLYHEIHALYAEKAHLMQKISVLEMENATLNALLGNAPTSEVEMERAMATCEEVAQVSSKAISPQFVSDLYPGTKALVLTRSLDLEPVDTPSVKTAASCKTYVMIESVGYAKMPRAPIATVEWNDDWQAASGLLPRDVVAPMLRLVMQVGIERLVVSDDQAADIALVAEVARLASLRLTVVVAAATPHVGWLQSHGHIDIIEDPSGAPSHVTPMPDTSGDCPLLLGHTSA